MSHTNDKILFKQAKQLFKLGQEHRDELKHLSPKEALLADDIQKLLLKHKMFFYKTYGVQENEAEEIHRKAVEEAEKHSGLAQVDGFEHVYQFELAKVSFSYYKGLIGLEFMALEQVKPNEARAMLALFQNLETHSSKYFSNPSYNNLKIFQNNGLESINQVWPELEKLGLKDMLQHLTKSIISFGLLPLHNKYKHDRFFVTSSIKQISALEKSIKNTQSDDVARVI